MFYIFFLTGTYASICSNKLTFKIINLDVPQTWEIDNHDSELYLTKGNNKLIFSSTKLDKFDKNEVISLQSTDLQTVNKMRKEGQEISKFDILQIKDTTEFKIKFIRVEKRYNNTISVRAKFQNLELESKVFVYGKNLDLNSQTEIVNLIQSIKFSED